MTHASQQRELSARNGKANRQRRRGAGWPRRQTYGQLQGGFATGCDTNLLSREDAARFVQMEEIAREQEEIENFLNGGIPVIQHEHLPTNFSIYGEACMADDESHGWELPSLAEAGLCEPADEAMLIREAIGASARHFEVDANAARDAEFRARELAASHQISELLRYRQCRKPGVPDRTERPRTALIDRTNNDPERSGTMHTPTRKGLAEETCRFTPSKTDSQASAADLARRIGALSINRALTSPEMRVLPMAA